jgi:hypothetical protein
MDTHAVNLGGTHRRFVSFKTAGKRKKRRRPKPHEDSEPLSVGRVISLEQEPDGNRGGYRNEARPEAACTQVFACAPHMKPSRVKVRERTRNCREMQPRNHSREPHTREHGSADHRY